MYSSTSQCPCYIPNLNNYRSNATNSNGHYYSPFFQSYCILDYGMHFLFREVLLKKTETNNFKSQGCTTIYFSSVSLTELAVKCPS